MNYAFMYWFTRLDHIRNLAEGVIVISIVVIIVAVMSSALACDYDLDNEAERPTAIFLHKVASKLKFGIATFCIALGILASVPTQKEAAAIYLIPKIANNEQVSLAVKDSASIVQLKLKEYLNNLIKEVKQQTDSK